MVGLVKGEVLSLKTQENLVGPGLDNLATAEDQDGVGALDGGESVGDDDAGATFLGFI